MVTLDEMKAKREVLVREHEKQLAAKLQSDEGLVHNNIIILLYNSGSYMQVFTVSYILVFFFLNINIKAIS